MYDERGCREPYSVHSLLNLYTYIFRALYLFFLELYSLTSYPRSFINLLGNIGLIEGGKSSFINTRGNSMFKTPRWLTQQGIYHDQSIRKESVKKHNKGNDKYKGINSMSVGLELIK